jgi:hypothetical protein
MGGDVHGISMEGEDDGMNMSISFKSDKRTLDRDIMNMCRLREVFILELMRVEIEHLKERVRSA